MDSYETKSKRYDTGEKPNENCGTRCCRHTLLWINGILAAIAITLIIVDIYGYQTNEEQYIGGLNIVLFVVVLSLGVIVLLVSLLGCLGAKTKSLCVFVTYVSGLSIALILECAIVIMCFDSQFLKHSLQQRWNDLSAEKQKQVENNLNCCGFEGTNNNRAGTFSGGGDITTTTMGECNGCYETITSSLKSLQTALAAIAIFLIIYQLFMCGCSVLLYRQKKERK